MNYSQAEKYIRPIVVEEFKSHKRRSSVCDFDDYFQEAMLAYLECSHSWTPERGLSFLTYLNQAIRQAINSLAFRFSSPLSVVPPTLSYDEDIAHHVRLLKKEFTLSEIAEILRCKPATISDIVTAVS
jgi:DNA-directed RNA polymerase specialized sigma subunit